MYKITCDGHPLLDARSDELILTNPKVKVEVNTVGEGSFEIYSNHPNFDKLKMLKSIFEVSDEYGVVFRGRMTELSEDFWNGKAVDLEGVLGFFNDSLVRPYDFPNDFLENEDYEAAYSGGNVVEYFLGWLIENHNSQVEEFQRFKLGNVTVSDPNNYITRSDSDYKCTWEILKEKLFDSSLGGKLCIRYEADGNYIDYLSEFTEINTQGIEYGSNLLDLMHDTSAAATYSAIIPLGAKTGDDADALRLTLDDLPDGDIDGDLVKSGDTIYSRSAVEAFGWIYAPPEETTWEDVTDPVNLRKKGAEWLTYKGIRYTDTVELSAADLHFSDSEIRSFRIYKKIPVHSDPHSILNNYDLTKLDLDLLNPQNTKITVGETKLTLTDLNGKYQNTIKKIKGDTINTLTYEIFETKSQIQKTESSILMKVEGDYTKKTEFETFSEHTEASLELKVGKDDNDKIVSMLNASADVITLKSNRLVIESDKFSLTADGTVTAEAGTIGGCQIRDGKLIVPAANITGVLTAEQINAGGLKLTSGEVAGMTIEEDCLYTNSHDSISDTNYSGVYIGTDGISILSSGGECSMILDIGNKNFSFKGDIHAESGYFKGEIEAEEGNIAGFDIYADHLEKTSSYIDSLGKHFVWTKLISSEIIESTGIYDNVTAFEVGTAFIGKSSENYSESATVDQAEGKFATQVKPGVIVHEYEDDYFSGSTPLSLPLIGIKTGGKTYMAELKVSNGVATIVTNIYDA